MMIVNGPNSALSKVGKVEGVPSTTNLDHAQRIIHCIVRCNKYLISPEMLSKIYWSNRGLLGFLEITPKIPTSRPRVCSWPGVSVCRAVRITRMAAARIQMSTMMNRNETVKHLMRWSFSATFSAVPALSILDSRVASKVGARS